MDQKMTKSKHLNKSAKKSSSKWKIAALMMCPRVRLLAKVMGPQYRVMGPQRGKKPKVKACIEDVKSTHDTWGKSFTQYVITITCGDDTWRMHKRYSEFVTLRKECHQSHRLSKVKLPKLPGKKLTIFMNEEDIQIRRKGLEVFLRELINAPGLLVPNGSPLVRFLGFLARPKETNALNEEIEAWNASYASRIPWWLYFLKALMPSHGDRIPIGLLRVRVVSAKNLPKMDLIGSSDPYVKLTLGTRIQEEAKTKHISNTLNPFWSEQFVFEVTNSSSILRLEVFDHDMVGDDDPIGHVEIALRYLEHQKTISGEFFLKPPEEDEQDSATDVKKNSSPAPKSGNSRSGTPIKAKTMTDEKVFDGRNKRDSKISIPKEKMTKKKHLSPVWDSKNPPRINLQLRYCYSRVGAMACYWNPEPKPVSPPPKFDIDVFYAELMDLNSNLKPIINFFYEFYVVLLWTDPIFSTWITICFTACCFRTWLIAVLLQCWLLWYIISKYVIESSKAGHVSEYDETLSRDGSVIITSAPPSPPQEEKGLGMIGSTVMFAIKSAGYVDDMQWYQNKIATVNWVFTTVYSLFDWSSSTTKSVLMVLILTTSYCLVFPVHFMTLIIGLYVLLMWSTPFLFVMWAVRGLARYLGREKILSVKAVQAKWSYSSTGIRALHAKSKRSLANAIPSAVKSDPAADNKDDTNEGDALLTGAAKE
ncbi:hypothetical protein AAMO2058_001417900 [Amorphochlora amoebiformis]